MTQQTLQGKKILLCVTGSIAAFKAVMLLRLLVKSGADVQVIMTSAATDFVSPLTFSTLSKNKVHIDIFEEDTWANHVMLARWADAMIIAPASCNTIAKMANGLCDNLLLAVWLSAKCPVLIAPAMDEDMWQHTTTQQNLQALVHMGNRLLTVNTGELASGLHGEGRMAEPEEIMEYLREFLGAQDALRGVKVLITAGPTQEVLDPVRYISNHSTGTMGLAIADTMKRLGATVKLVLGPTDLKPPAGIDVIKVRSASEMYDATIKNMRESDIIVMAAAVADYTPHAPSAQKMKKGNNEISIRLVKTQDILAAAGQAKSANQTLVGFALETNDAREHALEKLAAKNADLIVLNSLSDDGAGFGRDTNKITIFDNRRNEYSFDKKSKKEVAIDIVNAIINYRNA
jgi:phosphopantothenoylcysteine decarboxylase / phosphopantothenate---cysteine ligase